MSYHHTQIPGEIVPYLWNIYNQKHKSNDKTFTNISFTPPSSLHTDILELLVKSKNLMEIHGYKFRCTDNDLKDLDKEK